MGPFKFGKKSSRDKNQQKKQIHLHNDDLNERPVTSTPPKQTPPKSPNQIANIFHRFENSKQATNQNPPSSRIYPTPAPIEQRNVSSTSSTMPALHPQTRPTEQHQQPPTVYPSYPQITTDPSYTENSKTIWNRIKLQNSPFPRYRHVASSVISDTNQVYVIGGLHDQSVYGDTWVLTCEDPQTSTMFSSRTVDITETTPPPRVGHASTLCGNAFVIFGGDTHKKNEMGEMDDDIYLFNINSYKWTIPHPIGPVSYTHLDVYKRQA